MIISSDFRTDASKFGDDEFGSKANDSEGKAETEEGHDDDDGDDDDDDDADDKDNDDDDREVGGECDNDV